MRNLIVVDNVERWPLAVPGAEVVAARDYLVLPKYAELRNASVYNLCQSNAYQTVGYYVSLLATARRQRPLPSVTTVQDLKTAAIVRIAGEGLDKLVQALFANLHSTTFEISVYFGRNLAKRYDRLCRALFDHFPVPLLRASFVRSDRWRLQTLRVLALKDVPEAHHDFLVDQARRYFARPRRRGNSQARYDLAILVDPAEPDSPSNAQAISRFVKAAHTLAIRAETIGRDDYPRLAEYDGLFIRQTTAVNHHTYRFASRAAAAGLVVIDDPESIIRCTNKVYQAELFKRLGIQTPKTVIVHKDNFKELTEELSYPLVLKRPDSSFSLGVVKADNEVELHEQLRSFLKKSELVVAQEFVHSDFDWRIGVMAGKPLFACKYFMARGHWQIQRVVHGGGREYGRYETLRVEDAPARATNLAVRAANAIGDGLYGVDIKQAGGRFYVMEINDNPNVDAGVEDAVLKDELYLAIMRTFYERMESRGRGPGGA